MDKREINRNLELLEVSRVAVGFLGIDEDFSEPKIYMEENVARVNLKKQFCFEANMPTYDLNVDIQFNTKDKGIIDSVCVHQFWGDFDGYMDIFTSLFEGDYVEISEDTTFIPVSDNRLEVTSVTTEECGDTNKGLDTVTESKTTEVYEFNGDWKALSSDMKKVGQVSKKIKK